MCNVILFLFYSLIYSCLVGLSFAIVSFSLGKHKHKWQWKGERERHNNFYQWCFHFVLRGRASDGSLIMCCLICCNRRQCCMCLRHAYFCRVDLIEAKRSGTDKRNNNVNFIEMENLSNELRLFGIYTWCHNYFITAIFHFFLFLFIISFFEYMMDMIHTTHRINR